jgi:hypothetical protein
MLVKYVFYAKQTYRLSNQINMIDLIKCQIKMANLTKL